MPLDQIDSYSVQFSQGGGHDDEQRASSFAMRTTGRAIRGVAGVLATAFAVHACSLGGLDGLSGGDTRGPVGGGDGGADGPGVPSDARVPVDPRADAATTTLGPGEIDCASTTTVCDVRVAQCCVTVIGSSTAAARSFTASSAKCGPAGGGACSQLTQSNDTFTDQFTQRCGSARDCKAGESCCVLSTDPANRFGKYVSSIGCVAATQCATTGRAICAGPADCTPQENCLAETDPVLSHLYASFCQ